MASICSSSWHTVARPAAHPSLESPVLSGHKATVAISPTPSRIFSELELRGPARLSVVCMANPRRVKMVAEQIRREVSMMFLSDNVIKNAITPEHALGADRYLSAVATVSEVEVSGDLQVAKVYVSVFGDERGQELAIAGLKSVAGYVRQGLGKRMRLRYTPEVRFIHDEAMERGSRVLSILTQLRKEREAKERGETVSSPPVLPAGYDDDDIELDDFGDFENFSLLDKDRTKSNSPEIEDSKAAQKVQKLKKARTPRDGAGMYLL